MWHDRIPRAFTWMLCQESVRPRGKGRPRPATCGIFSRVTARMDALQPPQGPQGGRMLLVTVSHTRRGGERNLYISAKYKNNALDRIGLCVCVWARSSRRLSSPSCCVNGGSIKIDRSCLSKNETTQAAPSIIFLCISLYI